MKIIYAIDGGEIKVSDCDFLYLSGFNWSKNRKGYYQCTNRSTLDGSQTHGKEVAWFVAKRMGMIMPEGYQIDHIDRKPSNNQRSNLRAASIRLQNINKDMQVNNTSGYTGVYFNPSCSNNPWVAYISVKYRRIHLGCFPTKEKAIETREYFNRILTKKEEQRCLDQIELCKKGLAKCRRL